MRVVLASIGIATALWLIPVTAWSGPIGEPCDQDGIPTSIDNCMCHDNPSQCDTDLDGYGNACDSDYDNNGLASGGDFPTFGYNFGSTGPNIADGDCNGSVTGGDYAIFGRNFGKPPGPSGLSCAGTIPCN